MNILFLNVTVDLDRNAAGYYRHPRHKLPPLDIGYCISLAKKAGHTVLFHDTWVERLSYDAIAECVAAGGIDLVAIRPSIVTVTIVETLVRRIRRARSAAAVVVFGNVVSSSPEPFLCGDAGIDLAVIGEPELTMMEILKTLEQGRPLRGIRGTLYRREGKIVQEAPRESIADLDALPFPEHDEFLKRRYTFLYPFRAREKIVYTTMLTSRGCPFGCAHCSSNVRVSYGSAYRTRSTANVLEEIRAVRSKGVNTVYFCDDNMSAEWLERLCDAILSSGITVNWIAQSRVENLAAPLLAKMGRAGCVYLNVGIESTNTRVRAFLDKAIPLERIEHTVRCAAAAGINVNADFIIGAPGEEAADLDRALEFAKKMDFTTVTLLLFIAYPDSRLYREHGAPFDMRTDSLYGYGLDPRNLDALRKRFYLRYYLRPGYLRLFLARCFSLRNSGVYGKLAGSFITYMLRG